MKNKKLNRKLTLNKETISRLNSGEMHELRGAYDVTDPTLCGKSCESLLVGCCDPHTI